METDAQKLDRFKEFLKDSGMTFEDLTDTEFARLMEEFENENF